MKLKLILILSLIACSLQAAPAVWTRRPNIQGVGGAYTPFVVTNQLEVFSNTDGNTFGTFYRRTGATWLRVGAAQPVILPEQITDQTGSPFIRTVGLSLGASGTYYALLHVGDGYPSPTGYVPALATSKDGITWTYHGKLKLFDGSGYWSSSAAFIVQEDKPETLDETNPANNRFLSWQDSYNGKRLALIYSADGLDWRVWPKDVWPASLPDGCSFPAAVRTPYGYHIIAANDWPATCQRHLYSRDGVTWKVLSLRCATFVPSWFKGTNLFYDRRTNVIHAVTSGTYATIAGHWVLRARYF